MKKEILFFIIVFLSISFIIAANIEPYVYYKLTIKYKNGNISIINNDIEISNKKIDNFYGGYVAKVIDINDKTISLTNFDISNEALVDYVDPKTSKISSGGLEKINESENDIYIPYSENAKSVVIIGEDDKEISKLSVSEYSKLKQIGLESNSIDSEKNLNNKTSTNYKNNSKNNILSYWWILLLVIAIIMIIILIIKKRGK